MTMLRQGSPLKVNLWSHNILQSRDGPFSVLRVRRCLGSVDTGSPTSVPGGNDIGGYVDTAGDVTVTWETDSNDPVFDGLSGEFTFTVAPRMVEIDGWQMHVNGDGAVWEGADPINLPIVVDVDVLPTDSDARVTITTDATCDGEPLDITLTNGLLPAYPDERYIDHSYNPNWKKIVLGECGHAHKALTVIADRVLVMYGGQVVEHAPVRELFAHPKHPYTRALLETVPSVTGERSDRLEVIQGQPPILRANPSACPFRDRCGKAFDRCARENPARIPVGSGHDVACFWDPDTGGARDV